MTHEIKTEELEYQGYTTTIRTKGWWCGCGEGILEHSALRASERALLDLKAKVDCLTSWNSSQPDAATIFAVQSDLTRLGATCKVCVKRGPRGQWETVLENVVTFDAALDFVPRLLEDSFEVGIFLNHDKYGGIFIWTSLHPSMANRFDDFA